ncbi:hypothetical protein ACLOJK_027552 [Asimina triloba]
MVQYLVGYALEEYTMCLFQYRVLDDVWSSLSGNGEILGDEVAGMHGSLPKTKKIEDILEKKHNSVVHTADMAFVMVSEKQQKSPGIASGDINVEYGTAENEAVEENQFSVNGVSYKDGIVAGNQGREADVSKPLPEEGVEEGKNEENDVQTHEFGVGEFVWGKIKSHPWWPGQIYDPSDASGYAGKFCRRDRFLVAYFGDRTFAWCDPSQLKPFLDDFEQMSKQSNSLGFVNALEEALNELGRCVESEMICSCVPEETSMGLSRPPAVNAGIKEGVTIPKGHINELSITEFQPANFLARLREIAEVVSLIDLLEFTVLRSQLTAFHRAKGHGPLPVYQEPQGITYPEENADRDLGYNENEFGGQKREVAHNSAEEEWLSSPATFKHMKVSECRPEISEDKLFQRKKKSMAELMGEKIDSELETDASDVVEEGKVVGKPSLLPRRRDKTKNSASSSGRTGSKSENSEDGVKGGKTGRRATQASKRKRSSDIFEPPLMVDVSKTSSAENNDAEEGTVWNSPRVRKKSKYLSPPYTFLGGFKGMISLKDESVESPKDTLASEVRDSINVKDSETETPAKVSKIHQRVESANRTVSELTGSSPLVKCGKETFQKRAAKRKAPGGLSPVMLKESSKAHGVEMMDVASSIEMLSGLQLVALDCQYLHSSDAVVDFFAGFRHTLYSSSSDNDYKKFMEGTVSRNRKSQLSGHGSPAKRSGEEDLSMVASHDRRKKIEVKETSSIEKSFDASGHPVEGSIGEKMKIQHAHSFPDAALSGGKTETQLAEGLSGKAPDEADPSVPCKRGRKKKVLLSEQGSQIRYTGEADLSLGDIISRKRRSQFMHGSLEGNSNNGDLSGDALHRKKRKVKDDAISQSPKKDLVQSMSRKAARSGKVGRPRRVAGSSGVATDHKKGNGECPAALLLTFAPGVMLPSKDDLLKVFGKFGDLKDSETEVQGDSGCARVVFTKSSDGENAFNSSERKNAFGPALVSCKLRYLQALENNGSLQAPPVEANGTAGPPLQFMQQNLQKMMSMLSDAAQGDAVPGEKLPPDVRANLAGEINGLLEKVTTLVNTTSKPSTPSHKEK